MKAEVDKTGSNKSRAIAGAAPAQQKSDHQFADNRVEVVAQRELAGKADSSPQAGRIAQLQAMADGSAVGTVQRLGLEEEPFQGKFETVQKQEDEEEMLQGKFETVQKQEDEEEMLQGKFETVQKQEEEEEMLQGKFETVQKQEEEEEMLQGKFETIQKQEDEEELLQGKFETAQKQGEEEELLQGKFETVQKQEDEEELLQGKFETIQNKDEKLANNTGLPDSLKSGIEGLSGFSMDDVKVHYNSAKPARIQAHAFAQGTDIHMASGQEKHLPHEAWHVVQQKQGRVKPTKQFKGKVNVNDDAGLEKEADVMGAKAISQNNETSPEVWQNRAQNSIIQRVLMTGDRFIEISGSAFSGSRNRVLIVDGTLKEYQESLSSKPPPSLASKIHGIRKIINACREYLGIPEQKAKKRISGVTALLQNANEELKILRENASTDGQLPSETIASDIKIANSLFSPYLETHKVGDWISSEGDKETEEGRKENETGAATVKKKGSIEFGLAFKTRSKKPEERRDYWKEKGEKYVTESPYEKHKGKIPLWCDESTAIIIDKLKGNNAFQSRLDIVKKGNPANGGHWYVIVNRSLARGDSEPTGELLPGEFVIDIWGTLFLNERLKGNLTNVVFMDAANIVQVEGNLKSVLSLGHDDE